MPITRMDHFTILTPDAEMTVAFYQDVLGFTLGPRPAFPFPGAWLYSGDKAVLHVIERSAIPEGGGVLDHIAFWGEGLPGFWSEAQRGLGKANLDVVAKLFEDGLERGFEPETFSWRQIGGHDDVLDVFVGHFIDVGMTRQPAP